MVLVVLLVEHLILSKLTEITKSGKARGIYWAVSHDGSQLEHIGEFEQAGTEVLERWLTR
jgi:alpha-D-ribose 1-methylphosphonate 5-triphosphate diphosphatase PhnM